MNIDDVSTAIAGMNRQEIESLWQNICETPGGEIMEKFYLQLLIGNGDAADLDTVDDLEKTVANLNKAAADTEKQLLFDARRLHREIAEGNRDDAIDILSGIAGERFHSVREMRNLFGGRIP